MAASAVPYITSGQHQDDVTKYFQLTKNAIITAACKGYLKTDYTQEEQSILDIYNMTFAKVITDNMCHIGDTCPEGFISTLKPNLYVNATFSFDEFIEITKKNRTTCNHMIMICRVYEVVKLAKYHADKLGIDDLTIYCASQLWYRYTRLILKRIGANPKCAVKSSITDSVELAIDTEVVENDKKCSSNK